MKSPDLERRCACPTCSAPQSSDYAPFCSRRCADVDLHRWLSEGYSIPAVELDDESVVNAGD